jgi:glycosyltransferase involved in cell wall biosynthesis
VSTGLISIILPVHNQADHIGKIVQEYTAALAKVPNPHEFWLVANACKDNTIEVCQDLAKTIPTVNVTSTETGGWGLAVKLGLAKANGEIICYTNSARTSPDILALTLLYATVYPNVVIKANRKIRDNWRRRLGSLLYNLECRALFDLSVWDINGTPKVFPRNFEKLLHLSREDDLIDAEFNMICRREGYPVIEVPVFSTRRHSGKSTTNYGSAVKMYAGAYDLWKQEQKNKVSRLEASAPSPEAGAPRTAEAPSVEEREKIEV